MGSSDAAWRAGYNPKTIPTEAETPKARKIAGSDTIVLQPAYMEITRVMLAPRMTPIACRNVITPALTKPTSMTVVTELDWISDVTAAPVPQAINRLSVTALIILRSRLPATACMPSDMFFMPSRKIHRPPTTQDAISTVCS